MKELDLSTFENSFYRPGGSPLLRAAWFLFGSPLFRCAFNPVNRIRVGLLRLFGARIGAGVVIKPGVRVKYPWRLRVGDHSWLGEDCWIDNIADVVIGAHACVSQGAYLCTGNHDWTDPSFALILGPITIADGAWVGARALVCPGVAVGRLAILTAGSVAQKDLAEREIHSGNPAAFRKMRAFRRPQEFALDTGIRSDDRTRDQISEIL